MYIVGDFLIYFFSIVGVCELLQPGKPGEQGYGGEWVGSPQPTYPQLYWAGGWRVHTTKSESHWIVC